MNERLKKLRKELGYTQQEFSDRLGSKRNTYASYETGQNAPSQLVITSICRTFNVNEEWLLTGSGEMFLSNDREFEIAQVVQMLLNEESNSFKSKLITALAKLSVDEWEVLTGLAEKLLKKD